MTKPEKQYICLASESQARSKLWRKVTESKEHKLTNEQTDEEKDKSYIPPA